MQKTKNSKGFTLVELLVVIAIIGILSTLGMLSLKNTQSKAYDALIESDIANIRTDMSMCFNAQGGTYAGCTIADTFKAPACSGYQNYNLSIDAVNGGSYIVYGNLCAQSPYVFCADSTGFAGAVPEPAGSQVKCVSD